MNHIGSFKVSHWMFSFILATPDLVVKLRALKWSNEGSVAVRDGDPTWAGRLYILTDF